MRTERDADPTPEAAAADAAATAETLERAARIARDLEWLQKKWGPPQPRDPQRGQLGLPLEGEGRDWKNSGLPHRDHDLPDDDAPEGANG